MEPLADLIASGSMELVLGGNAVVLGGILAQLIRLSSRITVIETDLKWLKKQRKGT